ncbi:hypothetical protein B738_21545 [Photorhabdus temperata subsp. temperata M1021]|uniref:Uncharacterized protein n=1 Tax=Photorhabdus temperata J3 TaxID=1389415 RepID=U7QZ01_PHOTE|nr:hypothetical protein B738_21545 [Photorhabdus temperata subsp. temperata M1021]ERT12267.1 hypothetical protein O185_15135 [Photorhabdus temperata J3]
MFITRIEAINFRHLKKSVFDLDPEVNTVRLLFECSINKKRLMDDLNNTDNKKGLCKRIWRII